MTELGTRLGWAELLYWIAFYQREAELALPPGKRFVRPRTKQDAAEALDAIFAPRTKKA